MQLTTSVYALADLQYLRIQLAFFLTEISKQRIYAKEGERAAATATDAHSCLLGLRPDTLELISVLRRKDDRPRKVIDIHVGFECAASIARLVHLLTQEVILQGLSLQRLPAIRGERTRKDLCAAGVN